LNIEQGTRKGENIEQGTRKREIREGEEHRIRNDEGG
jgi:hypothetical protein